MRDPETLLEVMETRKDRGVFDPKIDDATWSIEATLILAHQTKRIADILESITWTPDDNREAGDDQQRALIVIQPHAEG